VGGKELILDGFDEAHLDGFETEF